MRQLAWLGWGRLALDIRGLVATLYISVLNERVDLGAYVFCNAGLCLYSIRFVTSIYLSFRP